MAKTQLILSFAVLIAVLPVTAHARDATDGKSADIATEKVICDRLYVKADAHAADYKAGVDVDGNPVVSADINDASAIVPEFLNMPLTVNFAEKLQKTLPQGMVLEPSMGNLKIYKSGRVEFNGQDITAPVAEACGVEPVTDNNKDYAPVTSPESAFQPLAGSVAPSSTGPEPKPVIKMPEGAVNVTNMPTMDMILGGHDSAASDIKK